MVAELERDVEARSAGLKKEEGLFDLVLSLWVFAITILAGIGLVVTTSFSCAIGPAGEWMREHRTLITIASFLLGVAQEFFQLFDNAGGVFYASTYLVLFAVPLFGMIACGSGFPASVVYICFAPVPITSVDKPVQFALKSHRYRRVGERDRRSHLRFGKEKTRRLITINQLEGDLT